MPKEGAEVQTEEKKKPSSKKEMKPLKIPSIPSLTLEKWELGKEWVKKFRKVLIDHAVEYKHRAVGAKHLNEDERNELYGKYWSVDEFLRLSEKAFKAKTKERGRFFPMVYRLAKLQSTQSVKGVRCKINVYKNNVKTTVMLPPLPEPTEVQTAINQFRLLKCNYVNSVAENASMEEQEEHKNEFIQCRDTIAAAALWAETIADILEEYKPKQNVSIQRRLTPLKRVIAALNKGANSLRPYATDTIEADGQGISVNGPKKEVEIISRLGTRSANDGTVTATRKDVYVRDDTVVCTDGVPLYERKSGDRMNVTTSRVGPNGALTGLPVTSEHYHPQGAYRFFKTNVSLEDRSVDDDSGNTPGS